MGPPPLRTLAMPLELQRGPWVLAAGEFRNSRRTGLPPGSYRVELRLVAGRARAVPHARRDLRGRAAARPGGPHRRRAARRVPAPVAGRGRARSRSPPSGRRDARGSTRPASFRRRSYGADGAAAFPYPLRALEDRYRVGGPLVRATALDRSEPERRRVPSRRRRWAASSSTARRPGPHGWRYAAPLPARETSCAGVNGSCLWARTATRRSSCRLRRARTSAEPASCRWRSGPRERGCGSARPPRVPDPRGGPLRGRLGLRSVGRRPAAVAVATTFFIDRIFFEDPEFRTRSSVRTPYRPRAPARETASERLPTSWCDFRATRVIADDRSAIVAFGAGPGPSREREKTRDTQDS